MVATPQRATLADLENTPEDGQRYELIDGVIVVAAAPTWQHQQIVGELYVFLRSWVQARSLGQVALAPVDVVLDESTVVEPDLVFVTTDHLANLRRGKYFGTPDLAVEVVSPTNRDHDIVTKMFHYARAGIPEYWLVDPLARSFSMLTLTDAMYVPHAPDNDGHLRSVILPGLTIDPAIVFAAGDIPGGHS